MAKVTARLLSTPGLSRVLRCHLVESHMAIGKEVTAAKVVVCAKALWQKSLIWSRRRKCCYGWVHRGCQTRKCSWPLFSMFGKARRVYRMTV